MAMKKCKSCGNEVSKSAKVCPNCGQKLKMGFWAKFGIGLVIIIVAVVALQPSSEEIEARLAEVQASSPSPISPSGELAGMFSIISDSTDIQRENRENEITGSIVEWTLPVFDVTRVSEENMIYRIQTPSSSDYVGAFIRLHARNEDEAARIEGLSEDDMISFKGEITGTSMRNITIENARLVK